MSKRKKYLYLDEEKGEIICPRCNGSSFSIRQLYNCPKCHGFGKLDWISKIIGERREDYTKSRAYSLTLKIDKKGKLYIHNKGD